MIYLKKPFLIIQAVLLLICVSIEAADEHSLQLFGDSSNKGWFRSIKDSKPVRQFQDLSLGTKVAIATLSTGTVIGSGAFFWQRSRDLQSPLQTVQILGDAKYSSWLPKWYNGIRARRALAALDKESLRSIILNDELKDGLRSKYNFEFSEDLISSLGANPLSSSSSSSSSGESSSSAPETMLDPHSSTSSSLSLSVLSSSISPLTQNSNSPQQDEAQGASLSSNEMGAESSSSNASPSRSDSFSPLVPTISDSNASLMEWAKHQSTMDLDEIIRSFENCENPCRNLMMPAALMNKNFEQVQKLLWLGANPEELVEQENGESITALEWYLRASSNKGNNVVSILEKNRELQWELFRESIRLLVTGKKFDLLIRLKDMGFFNPSHLDCTKIQVDRLESYIRLKAASHITDQELSSLLSSITVGIRREEDAIASEGISAKLLDERIARFVQDIQARKRAVTFGRVRIEDVTPFVPVQNGDECGLYAVRAACEIFDNIKKLRRQSLPNLQEALQEQKSTESIEPLKDWIKSNIDGAHHTNGENLTKEAVEELLKTKFKMHNSQFTVIESISEFSPDQIWEGDARNAIAKFATGHEDAEPLHIFVIKDVARKHWTFAVAYKTEGVTTLYVGDSANPNKGSAEDAHLASVLARSPFSLQGFGQSAYSSAGMSGSFSSSSSSSSASSSSGPSISHSVQREHTDPMSVVRLAHWLNSDQVELAVGKDLWQNMQQIRKAFNTYDYADMFAKMKSVWDELVVRGCSYSPYIINEYILDTTEKGIKSMLLDVVRAVKEIGCEDVFGIRLDDIDQLLHEIEDVMVNMDTGSSAAALSYVEKPQTGSSDPSSLPPVSSAPELQQDDGAASASGASSSSSSSSSQSSSTSSSSDKENHAVKSVIRRIQKERSKKALKQLFAQKNLQTILPDTIICLIKNKNWRTLRKLQEVELFNPMAWHAGVIAINDLEEYLDAVLHGDQYFDKEKIATFVEDLRKKKIDAISMEYVCALIYEYKFPLHWQILHSKDLLEYEYLEQNKEQFNVRDAFGVMPLSLAYRQGNISQFGRLLNAGANADEALRTNLVSDCSCTNDETIKNRANEALKLVNASDKKVASAEFLADNAKNLSGTHAGGAASPSSSGSSSSLPSSSNAHSTVSTFGDPNLSMVFSREMLAALPSAHLPVGSSGGASSSSSSEPIVHQYTFDQLARAVAQSDLETIDAILNRHQSWIHLRDSQGISLFTIAKQNGRSTLSGILQKYKLFDCIERLQRLAILDDAAFDCSRWERIHNGEKNPLDALCIKLTEPIGNQKYKIMSELAYCIEKDTDIDQLSSRLESEHLKQALGIVIVEAIEHRYWTVLEKLERIGIFDKTKWSIGAMSVSRIRDYVKFYLKGTPTTEEKTISFIVEQLKAGCDSTGVVQLEELHNKMRYLLNPSIDSIALRAKGESEFVIALRRGDIARMEQWGTPEEVNNYIMQSTKQTPLHLAVSVTNKNITSDIRNRMIQYLVSLGADINAKDDLGYTPLHQAVLLKRYEAVGELLNLGASVDIENQRKETALWSAVFNRGIAMIELLMSKGAKVVVEGSKNPLDLVRKSKADDPVNVKIIALLERAAAQEASATSSSSSSSSPRQGVLSVADVFRKNWNKETKST